MPRFRPGLAFRDGRLYEFTDYRVTVRSAGPEAPRAWSRTTRTPWRPVRPTIARSSLRESIEHSEADRRFAAGLPDADGQLPLALELVERPRFRGHAAYVAWLRTLDLEWRRLILPYSERHWHLLQLLYRCPGADDLVRSSPALAFALASSWVFRGHKRVCRPLRSARSLLRKPQRAILGWLGFCDSQSAARILQRVPVRDASIVGLLYLRDGLRDETIARRLAHVPTVSRVVIRIATDPLWSKLVTPRVLYEVSCMGESAWEVVDQLRESVVLARQLRPAGLERAGWIRSLARLQTFHDEMRYLHHRLLDNGTIDPDAFPPPPLAGSESIVPLTSPHMMLEEGEQQHNCAAGYVREVVSSALLATDHTPQFYLYRVLAPQRATLAIVKRAGRWHIDQLKASCNRRVTLRTTRAVDRWIQAHNGDDRHKAKGSI